MKAAIHEVYGTPDVIKIADVEKPVTGDNEVLIKVHAAALNPIDWHYLRGVPFLMRAVSGFSSPKKKIAGKDFAGVIETAGKNVIKYKPGCRVFGTVQGSLAEYASAKQDAAIALIPDGITFEQAAAIPIAAVTALQGLRDTANIKAGQRVLVNGASGGVGTYAVQIAKYYGAEVTAVCSTKNVDLVRSLGADFVIDYTKEDFTQGSKQYDIIIDNVGNRSILSCVKIMNTAGTYVGNGGGSVEEQGFWGSFTGLLTPLLLSLFVKQKIKIFLARLNYADLEFLGGLMQAGKLRSVIDKHYSLSEIKEAMYYLETGHAKGKIIIKI